MIDNTIKPVDGGPALIRLYNQWRSNFSNAKKNIEFDQLILKARRRTKLQNLGASFNEEALKVLIRSANEEARLHPFGKFMFTEKLTGSCRVDWHTFRHGAEQVRSPGRA